MELKTFTRVRRRNAQRPRFGGGRGVGAPLEVTAANLAIETFLPMDTKSAERLRALAESPTSAPRRRLGQTPSGGVELGAGSGLVGWKDRVETLRGTLELVSEPGTERRSRSSCR